MGPTSMAPPLLLESLPQGVGSVERRLTRAGLDALIGTDEVGRGSLAGPVVAAAVALPHDCHISGLDDSKRLSATARERVALEIRARARSFAVVELSAGVIDESDILAASRRAMACAVERVARSLERVDLVLVDGPFTIPLALAQRAVVRGDQLSAHIAAASILAKVHRDRLLVALHPLWPDHGFEQHLGYATVKHRAALRLHGVTPIHRRSFKCCHGH